VKISELAKETGVSERSLRYYESKKLISPDRLDNGYRAYSPFAVDQVKTIQLYIGLGFTTDQIAGFLHCVLKNKEAFCQEIAPIYESKIKELDEQIVLLTMLRSNLEDRMRAIREETDAARNTEATSED
jgi:DNA-binding transcriptional MerR regulator